MTLPLNVNCRSNACLRKLPGHLPEQLLLGFEPVGLFIAHREPVLLGATVNRLGDHLTPVFRAVPVEFPIRKRVLTIENNRRCQRTTNDTDQ